MSNANYKHFQERIKIPSPKRFLADANPIIGVRKEVNSPTLAKICESVVIRFAQNSGVCFGSLFSEFIRDWDGVVEKKSGIISLHTS